MFTTTHGLAGSVSECRGAAAAEGAAGDVVLGTAGAGLAGRSSADGVALAVADGVAVKVVVAADDAGLAASGEQALRAAKPDPASSRRAKTRLLGAGRVDSGAS
ncbi:hypothetical protein [Arthrobacter sp. YAF17]|uniref:hypothetical protein n=1 Tax=Arthrobacter sp. YAF17 TaxID=3233077 RepID=UPI003F8F3DDD